MRNHYFFTGLCIILALLFGAIPFQVYDADAGSTAIHEKVAAAILQWDGKAPGDLFKAVKAANPDSLAIVSMRELNKAIADKSLSADIMAKSGRIIAQQQAAQAKVRERVLAVRATSIDNYRRNNPEKARSLYGIGDIGSWPDKPVPDASMDIDWTIFGTNADTTAELRDSYAADLMRDLVGEGSGLTLKDFDVVVTAEGHEKAAGVFESEGGIDWAKRNMKRVTIIQPDGSTRAYVLGQGDPVAEMAMAENMALLRDTATRAGDYDKLFDGKGRLRSEVFQDGAGKDAQQLWSKYKRFLSRTEVDFYRSRADTAAGGCLDMAKHLHEEVLTKQFDPLAKMKKTLKYVERGDNISRGVTEMRKALAEDPLLSDPAYRDVIDLAHRVKGAGDAQVKAIIKERFGDTPDAALQELGNRSRRVILRMAEVSYMHEMDRILLDVADPGQRQARLDKLAGDMRIIADEGGEYSFLAKAALEQIGKMTAANKSGEVEVLRRHKQALEKLRGTDATTLARAVNFLNQTELGRKMLEMGGKVLEVGKSVKEGLGPAEFKSINLEIVEYMVLGARETGLEFVRYADSLAMWTEVVDKVRTAKSDAELAIALGQTLVNNTFFGTVLNTAYAGVVLGDNKALAKAIMFMLVPEAAIVDLVEALGNTAINVSAQTLFDVQMELVYQASAIDPDGTVTDFAGLGTAGLSGAREFIDILVDGDPGMAAQNFIDRSKATDFGKGADRIAILAVAKAVRSTVDNGNHLVFTDDVPLMTACAMIRKMTEDINGVAKMGGVTVPLAAGGERDLPGGLSPGLRRALGKLLAEREKARDLSRQAIAEAMIRTFAERRRAEVSLDQGTAKAEYEALLQIFKQLNIEQKGAASLDQAGYPYNIITAWRASSREKQVNAVKAVQRFSQAYSFVLQVRQAVEDSYAAVMGPGTLPQPRPLTGSLPLTANPEIDVHLTKIYLADVDGLGAAVIKDLSLVKKAPLSGAYDEEVIKKLYAARFQWRYWSHMMKAARAAQDLHWKIEIFDKQALYGKHDEASQHARKFAAEEKTIVGEFRRHYEIKGEIVFALTGPKQIESGRTATLHCKVMVESPGEKPRELPQDIARQFSFAWKSGKADLGESRESSRSYTLSTTGKHVFAVTIKRDVLAGGEEKQQELGVREWTVEVLAPVQETQQETAEESQKEQPSTEPPVQSQTTQSADKKTESTAAQSGADAPTCSYKYSDWGECDRATKKQRRSVIAKSPQGCVERRKPVLEQNCTPPPTEEEKRFNYYNCVCRCASGWAGHIGVVYDPEGKYTPECSSSGPCFGGIGAFGCTRRHSFGGSTECIKSCWEGVYGRGSFDEAKVRAEFRQENKKYNEPLSVKIVPSKNPLDYGDSLTLRAEVSGGAGGESWKWGGCAEASNKSMTTVSTDPACKPCTAFVTVTDQDGDSASASLDIKCNPLRVEISRQGKGPVTVGESVSFSARVFSGDKPISGPFVYHWQPHPEVAFDKLDATTPGVQAVFPEPGTVGVWVQVWEKRGSTLSTIAESDQLEIEVKAPELSLAFTPREPLVGQEVKAGLTIKPEVKEIDLRWIPLAGNAWQGPLSKDNREMTFYLKDEKPVNVTVMARVPVSGVALGMAEATIAAKKHTVSVDGPKVMGPPVQIWKEGRGLVTVEKDIATHQIVEFSASVKPGSDPLTYQWSVVDGPCSISNPSSRDARVTAGEAGTCTVNVNVFDKNKVNLGSGQGSFTATVTQEAIKAGQQKAKDVAEAERKVQSAKDKARKGDYAGAVADTDAAEKLDPADADAEKLGQGFRRDQERMDRHVAETRKLMAENLFREAEKELIIASNINSHYQPVQDAKRDLSDLWGKYSREVTQKMSEIRVLTEKKEFGQVLETAAAWRASTKLDPSADGELKRVEDWARQLKEEKDKRSALLKSGVEKTNAKDYAGAVKDFEAGFFNSHNYFNGGEPEYREAQAAHAQAMTAKKRLDEITGSVGRAVAKSKELKPQEARNALTLVEEGLKLQPADRQLSGWKNQLQTIIREAEKKAAEAKKTEAVTQAGTTSQVREKAGLALERNRFIPGEVIQVRFTAPADWPKDAWIGIVPSHIPHGDERQNDNHDVTYQYLNQRTSGTLAFTAPAVGNWDFRLHDTDKNGKEYASVSFQVEATPVQPTKSEPATQTGATSQKTTPSPTSETSGINLVGRWRIEATENGKTVDIASMTFNADNSYLIIAVDDLPDDATTYTVHGRYSIKGRTVTLKPTKAELKFKNGRVLPDDFDPDEIMTGHVEVEENDTILSVRMDDGEEKWEEKWIRETGP